MGVTDLTLLGH